MIRKLTLAFAAVLVSVVAFAQNQFQWKEASSGGYTYKYVTNDPAKARFYTLKNGLTQITQLKFFEISLWGNPKFRRTIFCVFW